MQKQGMKNGTLTEQVEDQNVTDNQRVTYLRTFCKWISEQGVSTSNEKY